MPIALFSRYFQSDHSLHFRSNGCNEKYCDISDKIPFQKLSISDQIACSSCHQMINSSAQETEICAGLLDDKWKSR